MNISLTKKLESLIQKDVESGLYVSSSEIVREALRSFYQKKDIIQLQKLIQKGLDSGSSIPLPNAEAFIRKAKKKYPKEA